MILKYILALLAVLTVFTAKTQTNSLVIFSEKGNPFYLILNSDSVNKTQQSNVKAFDLSSGWQRIEIKTIVSNTALFLKDSILLKDKSKFANKEFTYVLIQNGQDLKLKFESVSELSGPSVPPVPLAPKEVKPMEDGNIYGNLYKVENNKPVLFNNFNKDSFLCNIVLNEKDMKYAFNLLNKSKDEPSKYDLLNQILQKNCYTANQVKQLLDLVPIDMDKLNSAKLAYSHITDKQNVNLLLLAFKYQSMKDSYQSFLQDEENIIKQKNLKCKEPISSSKFEEISDKIRNGGYENSKLILAKKLLVDICLSTIQVKSLAQYFNHDRELLELFKCSYNVLTDKDKAIDLSSEFQFNETRQEYLKFLTK